MRDLAVRIAILSCMSVEYRAARPEEMREFAYSGRVGFGRSTLTAEIDHEVEEAVFDPSNTLCAFDDGVLAGKMAVLPLSLYWNRGNLLRRCHRRHHAALADDGVISASS